MEWTRAYKQKSSRSSVVTLDDTESHFDPHYLGIVAQKYEQLVNFKRMMQKLIRKVELLLIRLLSSAECVAKRATVKKL